MDRLIKLYAVAAVSFGLLDALWLGLVMGRFYRSQLWPIARTSGDSLAPLWLPALLVYGLLALGTVAFVVPRALVASPALSGALFGLVVYGVYDLTNHATLRSYSPLLAVVDIAWGVFASAAVAAIVTAVSRHLK